MLFMCTACGQESRVLELNQVHYPRESWVGEPASAGTERAYKCEHCHAVNDLKRSLAEWLTVDEAAKAG